MFIKVGNKTLNSDYIVSMVPNEKRDTTQSYNGYVQAVYREAQPIMVVTISVGTTHMVLHIDTNNQGRPYMSKREVEEDINRLMRDINDQYRVVWSKA